jgi:hypothetical protein
MNDIFSLTDRPDPDLFFSRNDPNDPRLGETVWRDEGRYAEADIVIVGCPQDEGVRRNNGRVGAALAPSAVRRQFYKLTPFGIKRRIFDLGDVKVGASLEETHDTHCTVVKRILQDGKRAVVVGGGNDISYPDGVAMAEVYGAGTGSGSTSTRTWTCAWPRSVTAVRPTGNCWRKGTYWLDDSLRSATKAITVRRSITNTSGPSAYSGSASRCFDRALNAIWNSRR